MNSDNVKVVRNTPSVVKKAIKDITRVAEIETNTALDLFVLYTKIAYGNATEEDIVSANRKAQEVMKYSRFTALMSFPGAFFVLPMLTQASKNCTSEIIPTSVLVVFGDQ